MKRRNTLEKYNNKSIKNNVIIEKKISIKNTFIKYLKREKVFGKKKKKNTEIIMQSHDQQNYQILLVIW